MKAIFKKLFFGGDCDILTKYSLSHNVFISKITINSNVAGFFEGIESSDSKILYILRVATNKKYYHYSPGQILFCNEIENLKKTYNYFDLTRGAEDYKLKLNGIIKVNHNYVIEVK